MGGHSTRRLLVVGALVCLVLVPPVAFAIARVTGIVGTFGIPTAAMAPTIDAGDRILTVGLGGFKTGDIVVFSAPAEPSVTLVKRVVAVGGQRVNMRDGVVIVDGNPLDEPYLAGATGDAYTMDGPFPLSDNAVWVLGDNRADSRDSRHFGSIAVSAVSGRVVAIYWPPARARLF